MHQLKWPLVTRLLGLGREGATDRSAMDLALADAESLRRTVSQADQSRLDQYFDSIRAL